MEYLAVEWTESQRHDAHRLSSPSSPYLEALTILTALKTWGPRCQGRCILIFTDAQVVSGAIARGYAPNDNLQALIMNIRMCSLMWNISLSCIQIPRERNKPADLLSRGQIPQALCLAAKQIGADPLQFKCGPPLAQQPHPWDLW
jgi:hypothetical protein